MQHPRQLPPGPGFCVHMHLCRGFRFLTTGHLIALGSHKIGCPCHSLLLGALDSFKDHMCFSVIGLVEKKGPFFGSASAGCFPTVVPIHITHPYLYSLRSTGCVEQGGVPRRHEPCDLSQYGEDEAKVICKIHYDAWPLSHWNSFSLQNLAVRQ